MLLKRFRTDDGSAMIAAIGVAAVGMILLSVVTAATVQGFTYTAGSRANVQAQSAADAGIAVARASLYTANGCSSQPTPGVYTSGTYKTTVQYEVNGGWVAGCPMPPTTEVRLVSTGTATAQAPTAAASNNTVTVETILNYLWPSVQPTGTAMYTYSGLVLDANGSVDVSEATGPGIVIRDGVFQCSKPNDTINGSIYVGGSQSEGLVGSTGDYPGTLDLSSNSCTVNKDAWATTATLLGSKGKVLGNLLSPSLTASKPATQAPHYSSTGTMPTPPPWVNLTYPISGWPNPTSTTWTGISCSLASGNLGTGITGATLLVNALGCPNFGYNQNTTISLNSDVVIYSKQFDFSNLNGITFNSTSSDVHHIWFITPDEGTGGVPKCGTDESGFTAKNGFVIQSPVVAMLYTPCAVSTSNNFVWHGQIYAGTASAMANNPVFSFSPIGIAGVDLSSGATGVGVSSQQPGSVISNRDITP